MPLDTPPSSYWIATEGGIQDGFSFYGPFSSKELAEEFADGISDGNWRGWAVHQLQNPNSKYDDFDASGLGLPFGDQLEKEGG